MTTGRTPITDVVVVGAGMSGLTAAGELASHGLGVLVLDKGRAVGGRMATRRIDAARFDHGAQHFSVRSALFRDAVARWMDAGIVAEWYSGQSITRPERGVESRLIAAGGMRNLPTALAQGLDVRTNVRVLRVGVTGDGVEITTDRGRYLGRSAIVTAPAPQALDLVDLSSDARLRDKLASITYDPCFAVMAHLDEPANLDDGHVAPASGAVAWIADNLHKGVSGVPAVTVHSSAAFARERLHRGGDDWVDELVGAARPYLGVGVSRATGHVWRYSQPQRTWDIGSRTVKGAAAIIMAGELYAGAKVEGAFRSGRAAASRLLEYLG